MPRKYLLVGADRLHICKTQRLNLMLTKVHIYSSKFFHKRLMSSPIMNKYRERERERERERVVNFFINSFCLVQ